MVRNVESLLLGFVPAQQSQMRLSYAETASLDIVRPANTTKSHYFPRYPRLTPKDAIPRLEEQENASWGTRKE